jgi:hypothetical protein
MKIWPKVASSWLSVIPVAGLMRFTTALLRCNEKPSPDREMLDTDENEELTVDGLVVVREVERERPL